MIDDHRDRRPAADDLPEPGRAEYDGPLRDASDTLAARTRGRDERRPRRREAD